MVLTSGALQMLVKIFSLCIFKYMNHVTAYTENSILGVPKVICDEKDLSIDIVTEEPFRGNIFVKGKAKDPTCKQSFSVNSSNFYSLPLGKCGMQRLRSVNPRGINFVTTVIVSFHPRGFITKNDRAFHIKCFYMEPEEIVTSSLIVSELTPADLHDSLQMPVCDYSVRRDGINGPQLAYANVGDTVYHVWQCGGAEMGMLVKKCFVTDGNGENHAVIDFDGCAIDDYLLSDLTYDRSLMRASAQSQVFKYADTNQLFFTCQIQLCQLSMGLCEGVSPPSCKDRFSSNRSRRNTQSVNQKYFMEIDVVTPEMLIGGVDDATIQIAPICFSPSILVLSNLTICAFITVIVVIYLVVRNAQSKKKSVDISYSS